jgi:hypothetical protein
MVFNLNKDMPRKTQNRNGKLLGGYVPQEVHDAASQWVSQGHERSLSKFLRTAAREKLQQRLA